MYKLLTTAGFFAAQLAVAVTNYSSGAELGAQTTGTLSPFALDSNGVLMCSELVVPLFGSVGSEDGGGVLAFYRTYQNVTFICIEEFFFPC